MTPKDISKLESMDNAGYSRRIKQKKEYDLHGPPEKSVTWTCTIPVKVTVEGQTAFRAFKENPEVFKGVAFHECKNWKHDESGSGVIEKISSSGTTDKSKRA